MKILLSLWLMSCIVLFQKYGSVKSYYYEIDEAIDCSRKEFLSKASDAYYCYINLHEKEKKYEVYYMVLTSSHPMLDFHLESIDRSVLSFGNYENSNDSLIFTDDIYGYKMYLNKNGNVLTTVSSFLWLNNKSFVYDKNGEMDDYDDWYHYNIDQVKRNNNKNYTSTTNFSCGAGVYHGVLMDINYYIELDNKSNYCYYIEKMAVSKGKWEKQGREILLRDSSVNAEFSLLITTEGLVSQLVPGDYEGKLVFKKIR